MRYGKASRVTGEHIEVPLWLIFTASGNVRLTRGEPDLSRQERAMRMTVKVPLALFKTPTISATLTIDAPEMAVPQIDVVAAAEALKGALGCDIDVRLASADTRPQGGDATEIAAPFTSGAVPKADAQPQSGPSQ